MKLIDLLVQTLPGLGGWPDGVNAIAQRGDGSLGARPVRGCLFDDLRFDMSDDWLNAVVTREQYEAALAAAQQPVWSGEGLPPVGCECEVKVGGDYFNLCRVVYSDKSCGVAFVYLGGGDEKYCGQIDCVSAKASSDYFRPIRSEADKKRDAIIEALAYHTNAADAADLYKAIEAGEVKGVKLDV